MPAFATHEIFGEEGLEGILSVELTQAVSKHKAVFRTGCQGPDLFFYNPFLLAGKKEINLGSRMHETKMNRFFQVYLEELLRLKKRFDLETGISYFMGFLSHYSLDCELHPYIYSRIGYVAGEKDTSSRICTWNREKTGKFAAGVKHSAGRTLPAHHRLEAVMDMQMLMTKRECMPSAYYPEKRIRISKQELGVIAGIMSRTLQKVYYVLIKPEHVRASYWCMKTVVKQVYDHSGQKKDKVCRFEAAVWHRPVIGNMMVNDHLENEMDAMNQNGSIWANPWDKEKSFDASVWELYDNAGERYQGYTKAIEPVLAGMLKRMLLLEKKQSRAEYVAAALSEQIPKTSKALGNRNYHSGL